MSTLLRSLRVVTEFVDSAVRYGLPSPDSTNINRWGGIDVQVSDISAWASYCDDAEPVLNKPGDLHAIGFDAEWATLRASDFGAPTPRERVKLLAYPSSVDGQSRRGMGASGIGESPIATRGLRGLAVAEKREAARSWLASEPRVDRLVDGVPDQSLRLKCAGNAVVPAVAEHLGRLIVEDAAWRDVREAVA